MRLENKNKIAVVVLLISILAAACVFWAWSSFYQIKEAARSFVLQKNRLAELEARKENLRIFIENREQYRAGLERIDKLFVNAKEPIAFIEFLEKEAALTELTIEIIPFTAQAIEGEPWQSIHFQISVEGDFPRVARFLERLERNDYLLQLLNLNINRLEKKEGEIKATLTIKVYSK